MVDKKTGPVKPPVIDMTAREAAQKDAEKPRLDANLAASKPAEKPADPTPGTPHSGPEKPPGKTPDPAPTAKPHPATPPQAAPTLPLIALAASGIGGAVLGFGLAYGLASAGLWPQQAPAISPAALTALEQRIGRIENTRELDATAATSLSQRLSTAETELTGLATTLEAGLASAASGDSVSRDEVADLAGQITALGHAIDALQAGASSQDAARIGSDLAALGTSVAGIEARIVPLALELAALSSASTQAQTRLAELEARLADQPEVELIRAERDRLARIPAAIGALEAGVNGGQAFAPALASLEDLLPALAVSDAARRAAANGVESMDALLVQYRALLPALLAARPVDPEAGWFETLVDQARAAVALRPSGEIEGDAPDALLARAETALERGDVAIALSTLAALPEPMRDNAEPILAGLGARFAAHELLDQARALAAMETQQ